MVGATIKILVVTQQPNPTPLHTFTPPLPPPPEGWLRKQRALGSPNAKQAAEFRAS